MEVAFRKLPPLDSLSPQPGDLFLVPTSRLEADARKLASHVFAKGSAGLIRGEGPVGGREVLLEKLGAGISMGFAEALSDDGSLTGRGAPVLRGITCGAMTFLGGIGHTLPYLIPVFAIATAAAFAVVAVELVVISYIRYRYMDTPFLMAAFQVIVGGVLVFAAGILIGSS